MAAIAPLCHAYVLHSRPYREKSRLVEFWTLEHGRISGLMRQTVPPLFQPCLVAWRGKNPLKNIVQCESVGLPHQLQANATFAGFYLNELLVRLLIHEEQQPELFALYSQTLVQLSAQIEQLEPVLRHFERCLLAALGYALDFRYDHVQQKIVAEQYYQYQPEIGFYQSSEPPAWEGWVLLAIAAEDWQDLKVRRAAKQIIRLALAVHLGNKPLKSRELMTYAFPRN